MIPEKYSFVGRAVFEILRQTDRRTDIILLSILHTLHGKIVQKSLNCLTIKQSTGRFNYLIRFNLNEILS